MMGSSCNDFCFFFLSEVAVTIFKSGNTPIEQDKSQFSKPMVWVMDKYTPAIPVSNN